jgi:hypothetical protein
MQTVCKVLHVWQGVLIWKLLSDKDDGNHHKAAKTIFFVNYVQRERP